MIRITWEQLRSRAAERPNGYIEDVIAHAATRDQDGIELTPEAWHALRAKYSHDAMEEPSLLELARNFAGATARWAAAGMPVVSPDTYHTRLAACEACPEWQAAGMYARCGLCGCTKLKLWLATEKCPLAKWPKDPFSPPSATQAG